MFLHTYSVLIHDYVNLIRDVLLLLIAKVLENSENRPQPQNVRITTYGATINWTTWTISGDKTNRPYLKQHDVRPSNLEKLSRSSLDHSTLDYKETRVVLFCFASSCSCLMHCNSLCKVVEHARKSDRHARFTQLVDAVWHRPRRRLKFSSPATFRRALFKELMTTRYSWKP